MRVRFLVFLSLCMCLSLCVSVSMHNVHIIFYHAIAINHHCRFPLPASPSSTSNCHCHCYCQLIFSSLNVFTYTILSNAYNHHRHQSLFRPHNRDVRACVCVCVFVCLDDDFFPVTVVCLLLPILNGKFFPLAMPIFDTTPNHPLYVPFARFFFQPHIHTTKSTHFISSTRCFCSLTIFKN